MPHTFLGPLREQDLPRIRQQEIEPISRGVFVASGRVALQLLFRSLGLQPGARVALPALICPVVIDAILRESLLPDFVDISLDHFFMLFEKEMFFRKSFDAIVLPHLYGVLHPQTEEIMTFAEENAIPLIHDAAQSFGLSYQGKPIVAYNQGGLYSFGAGKATTAATGALVYGVKPQMILRYQLDTYRRWDFLSAQFLRQRCAASYWRYFLRFQSRSYRASTIQVKAAQYVLKRIKTIESNRKVNWEFLNTSIGPDVYSSVGQRVSFFKFLYYSEKPLHLDKELAAIPLRTATKQQMRADLPSYQQMTGELYELSTERSLDEYQNIFSRKNYS